MIGGLTSGLSTALRTATAARATMDDMTRQIATGKRVASVKDDGAAWARANAMRSDETTWRARADVLDLLKVDLETTTAVASVQAERWQALRDIVLRAHTTVIGSQARQALNADWTATIAALQGVQGSTTSFPNASFIFAAWNSGIASAPGDDFLSGGGNWMIHPDLSLMDYTFNLVPIAAATFNLLTATSADLDQIRATIDSVLGDGSGGGTFLNLRLQEGGRDLARAERMGDHAQVAADRLTAMQGALVDADLGAASTARAQAETRQALAMQTVRQALDTYQAKATGLLSNVQRTQRSVLA